MDGNESGICNCTSEIHFGHGGVPNKCGHPAGPNGFCVWCNNNHQGSPDQMPVEFTFDVRCYICGSDLHRPEQCPNRFDDTAPIPPPNRGVVVLDFGLRQMMGGYLSEWDPDRRAYVFRGDD